MIARMNGMEIVTTETLTVYAADWSVCRSPSRAARRIAKGKRPASDVWKTRPNPNALVLAGKIYMHPATFHRFKIDMHGARGFQPEPTT